MQSIFTPFKVGMLIIAAMVALVFMIGKMSQSAVKKGSGYTVYAILDNATGLKAKSRVMMAGIPVGEVSSIELSGNRARVNILVRDEVTLLEGIPTQNKDDRTTYTQGATITKKQASMLGDYYLELSPGLEGEALQDGDRIYNAYLPADVNDLVVQMNDLAGSLKRISADVEDITGNMRDVFGDPKTALQLNRILDDIEGTTSSLESIMKDNQRQIHAIVGNIEAATGDIRSFTSNSASTVDRILDDVQTVTSEVRYLIGESSADVQEGIGTLTGTMSSMQLALDNLNYSLANVQEITDRMVDGEGTVGKLLTDDSIAVNANRAIESVADLVEPISRIQTWMELRSEYNLRQKAFKNYVAISIRPNPNKFYTIEFIDDPRGYINRELRAITSTDPEKPGIRYEEIVTTSNRFQFSLQIGQRWAIAPNDMLYLGGRVGVMESSGGLGANIWAFKDGFEMRADLFDFAKNARPRLRIGGYLYARAFFANSPILRNFFIHGGVDDLMNQDVRDYYIGAGLQFNDRDLKSILSVAPVPNF